MKMKCITILFLILSSLQINAQFFQIDMELLYEYHSFFSFNNGVTATDPGKSWEIGFAVHNQQEGGILINEYAERNMVPAILRIAPTNNFNDVININSVVLDTLRNDEINWNSGGFNKPKVPNTPSDYGWGTKVGNTIVGDRVFVISLPDTTFKKVIIDSLDAAGNYHFKYADLDGSNLTHQSFNISQHAGKTLAYFSFDSNSFVNIEPFDWDLFFCRYSTYANLGGSSFNYTVTGVLSGLNVEVVELDNVDPYTANPQNHCYDFSTDISTIGHDWKTFDLPNFEWIVDMDRVFFVKLPNGEVWRLFLFDFEGAFTGIITFEYANMGFPCFTTSAEDLQSNFTGLKLFPNPSDGHVEMIFDLIEERDGLEVRVTNMLGQVVSNMEITGNKGLNALRLPDLDLANGTYIIQLVSGNEQISEQLIINR